VLAHVDNLRRGYELKGGACSAGGLQQGPHGIFLTNEDNGGPASELFGGQKGTRHGGLGGEIAAHCVEGYFHEKGVRRKYSGKQKYQKSGSAGLKKERSRTKWCREVTT